jgi:hypothetical protein
MIDQVVTIAELERLGVRVRSVTENIDDTPTGKLMRNVKGAFNQFENDEKADRTTVGMKQAAKLGRFPFKAPIGYINVSRNRGHNLIPDPKTAPLISKAFDLFATGTYSKADVLKKVNTLGLTTSNGSPMPMQTLQRLLVNPIYAGWVTIPKWGMTCQGAFEPIVSQRVFDIVQDVLEGRKVVAKAYDHNNPDFPLRVFVRCAKCGAPFTGGWSTGKKKKYAYYRCRQSKCDLNNIGRDDLEASFIQLLKHLTPPPDLVAEFLTTVRSAWRGRQGDAETAFAAIQKRLDQIRRRKDKLVDTLLDGVITESTYREKDTRLSEDIDAAEVDLRQVESQFLDLEGVLTFAEKIISSPARLWLESSLDQRQRLQHFSPMASRLMEEDLEHLQLLHSLAC